MTCVAGGRTTAGERGGAGAGAVLCRRQSRGNASRVMCNFCIVVCAQRDRVGR